MSLIRRQDYVWDVQTDLDLQPLPDAKVTAYKAGGVAKTVVSVSTNVWDVTVYAGHNFVTGDKTLTNINETSFGTVTNVTGDVIRISTTVTPVSGDVLTNLGLDTGTISPVYDGSRLTVYSNPDTSNPITSPAKNTVLTNSSGFYAYWHDGLNSVWELVRDSTGTPLYPVQDAFHIRALSSSTSAVDNAIVRADGTGGSQIQTSYSSNTPTISDTGAVSIPGTLTVGGAATFTSGTFASTLTATLGIGGGIPRMIGTWNAPSATGGTAKTPVITEMYVGSIFVPMNCNVTGIQFLQGTATPSTQTVIVALYDVNGTKVANSTTAGTAMTTSPSVTKRIPFTGAYGAIGPGYYYIGIMYNTATSNLAAAIPVGADGGNGVVGGTVTGLTFGTLPNPISPPLTFPATAVVPIASLY